MINAKETLGLKGDGESDDYYKLMSGIMDIEPYSDATVNAFGGAEIYFPPGVYKLSEKVCDPRGILSAVRFRGASSESTKLVCKGIKSNSHVGFRAEGLTIESDGVQSNTGLDLGDVDRASMEYSLKDLRVTGFDVGIDAKFIQRMNVDNVSVERNVTGLILRSATSADIYNIVARENEDGVVLLRDGPYYPVVSCFGGIIESNSVSGISVDCCHSSVFRGQEFENNATAIVVRSTGAFVNPPGVYYLSIKDVRLRGDYTTGQRAFAVDQGAVLHGGRILYLDLDIVSSGDALWDLRMVEHSTIRAPGGTTIRNVNSNTEILWRGRIPTPKQREKCYWENNPV